MIPRRLLTTLVYGLPISALVFAVLMGTTLLADALQDALGARVLRWAAVLVLVVLVTDLLLLVTLLGWRSLHDTPRDE